MYDIFQDIHGQATKLKSLLRQLGYAETDSGWAHKDRKAIFVGDLIDGGSENREVLSIVRTMVDKENGLVILGNHELNAIAYTLMDDSTGDYYRPHRPEANHQHQKFLDEFKFGSEEHLDVINWFRTLPLFLDMGEFRVVHACWDNEAVATVKYHLGDSLNLSDDKVIHNALSRGTQLNNAIEHLLKGKDVELPNGITYLDNTGKERNQGRLKWWNVMFAKTFADMVVSVPQSIMPTLESEAMVVGMSSLSGSLVPVFCGHYKLQCNEGWVGSVMCLDIYDRSNPLMHVFSMSAIETPKFGVLTNCTGKVESYGMEALISDIGNLSNNLFKSPSRRVSSIVAMDARNLVIAQADLIKDLSDEVAFHSGQNKCGCNRDLCGACCSIKEMNLLVRRAQPYVDMA